jgi:glycosyltransferase involved in cell wall biosynthesis
MDLVCFATKGAGSNEEDRIRTLLSPLRPRLFQFDRASKRLSFVRLLDELRTTRPDVVVMEGTGAAGGVALLIAHGVWDTPFVVSSGDAVAPFIAATRPALRPIAKIYEWLLYRWSSGFIGWTPYLVGRALTLGAPRAMTAAGWAPYPARTELRDETRRELGIPSSAVVFGLVGALEWNRRVGYCYGYELLQAVRRVTRDDLYVLVAGDGTGTPHLKNAAGALLGGRVLLPGAIPQTEVPAYLSAIDVVSLPQSVDGVGSFRYTTKVSEYLSARRPVVTGQIPLAYDFGDDWLWRLPGEAPWDERYIAALAGLMTSITPAQISERSAAIPDAVAAFDRDSQQRQVVSFIEDIVARNGEMPQRGNAWHVRAG